MVGHLCSCNGLLRGLAVQNRPLFKPQGFSGFVSLKSQPKGGPQSGGSKLGIIEEVVRRDEDQQATWDVTERWEGMRRAWHRPSWIYEPKTRRPAHPKPLPTC